MQLKMNGPEKALHVEVLKAVVEYRLLSLMCD